MLCCNFFVAFFFILNLAFSSLYLGGSGKHGAVEHDEDNNDDDEDYDDEDYDDEDDEDDAINRCCQKAMDRC